MPRYIDADALKPDYIIGSTSTNTECYRYVSLNQIMNAPTANVVEVVRCKDCKWYDMTSPYGTVIPDAYHCKMNDRFYGFEHFCAYGERKE